MENIFQHGNLLDKAYISSHNYNSKNLLIYIEEKVQIFGFIIENGSIIYSKNNSQMEWVCLYPFLAALLL